MALFVAIPATILGAGALALKAYTKYTCGWYTIKEDMTGKVVLITGANSGIGKETALKLAEHGARVYLACRNLERAQAAAEDIKTRTNNAQVHVIQCQLDDYDSVRRCAKEFLSRENRLHVLINNAGIGSRKAPGYVPANAEGHETLMAGNHLGPFLLTNLLLDTLKASAPSRILNTSSLLHKWAKSIDFDGFIDPKNENPYQDSKLANVLFTRELAHRLHGTGVSTNCLHPGGVKTNIFSSLNDPIGKRSLYANVVAIGLALAGKNAEEGAQTTIRLACDTDLDNVSGHYFADCKPQMPNPIVLDDQLCSDFWERSAQLVGLK